MDFVGADDQIVELGVVGQSQQFVARPAAADRVVRVAEQEQPGGGRRRLPQGGHVPVPAVFVESQVHTIQLSAGKVRRTEEGRVDRRCRQHLAVTARQATFRPVTRPGSQTSHSGSIDQPYSPCEVSEH